MLAKYRQAMQIFFHWVIAPPKKKGTYIRHQNRINCSIRPKGNQKCRLQMAAILNSNMAASWCTICDADCYHLIHCPRKHIFRHQDKVNCIIRSKDNQEYRFPIAAILNSNMAAYNTKYAMQIVTIGSSPPQKKMHLNTRRGSIAA